MLRNSCLRPKGAVINQSRATPWDHVQPHVRALQGRNKTRFFTGDSGIATSQNCAALSGLAVRWNPSSQGIALGCHVAVPSGRKAK